MKVPLLDLKSQYRSIKAEVDAAIAEVMESQHFILGPKVERLEQAVARYSSCAHGIGVSSGSDALLACLMAEDIGPGDEVITTAYSFFATAGAIARVGATPVFVDIDPATYNLDVAQIASRVTLRTRAIIPVHLYGQMADMDAVMAVARDEGLVVIEDAAQAIGAEYQGRRAGSIGHYGCLSFFPSKNLGAAGDGGMIVTNDPARASKLECLRAHGARPKYYHSLLGGNFRLDAIQAAVVGAKFPHLDDWTAARQRNAERYDELLADAGLTTGSNRLVCPVVVSGRHVFNQYVIRVPERDALKSALQKQGVSTEVYYPVPLHLQECFAYLGYQAGSLPHSERAAAETLALPIHPEVNDEQARYVVDCIADFFAASASLPQSIPGIAVVEQPVTGTLGGATAP
jgi:dTDP-4-amino-4,6-dideoxygalactose transaminase